MTETQSLKPDSPDAGPEIRPLVFLGGINYDKARNEQVGKVITGLSAYTSVITLEDESHDARADEAVVFEYADGIQQELPSKLAMKQLNDEAVLRYTKLHERRARELISAIEAAHSGPVDAIFQSVDTSTGILAMRQRPELFRKVVLVDPSSIVKHPSKARFFKEGILNGSVFKGLKKPKSQISDEHFENSLSTLESYSRMKKTARFGNMNATYLSAQAKQLHDIAQSASAPIVSIVASGLDHAYTPAKILESLVDLNDIATMFITNSRHGINSKTKKLLQVLDALQLDASDYKNIDNKITFAEEVSDTYRSKLINILHNLTK